MNWLWVRPVSYETSYNLGARCSWFREKPDAVDLLWVRPVSYETSYEFGEPATGN